MRTTLIAALALTAASLPTITTIAEACGGYMPDPTPRMFVVSHGVAGPLVLVDQNVADAETLAWRRVSPSSYDMTHVAAAPLAARARTFTLVGDHKTTTVSSRRAVVVKSTFQNWKPANAFRVDVRTAGSFQIAIDGSHTDARWADMQSIEATPEITDWVRHPPFTPAPDPNFFSVMHVAGTDIDSLTTYTDGVSTTYTRRAGAAWTGGYMGTPHGLVTVGGIQYLVLVEDGIAMPIRV